MLEELLILKVGNRRLTIFNSDMKYLLLALAIVLSSCATNELLHVDSFHLRDIEVESFEADMVRGEERKRLYGAVSVAEQQRRLGLYYRVSWNDPNLERQRGRLKFEYLQRVTGAKVQSVDYKIPDGESKGATDFTIIGEDYIRKGRVLAWRLTYWRAGTLIESKQSYLWE